MPSEASTSLRQSPVVRLRFICKPQMVWQAFLAAGLVGTVLVALNQGDVWWSGHVTRRVLMKSLLTPIIPFCVTLLGAFLEASIHRGGGREPLRNIIARPIGGGAVHTIISPEPGQRGPWSFLTDTPHPTQDMVGPPATHLAIAAWAA